MTYFANTKKEFCLSDKIIEEGYYISIEDVYVFIGLLKKEIDVCADKTDIWDNERWDKFRSFFKKAIDKLAGEVLK